MTSVQKDFPMVAINDRVVPSSALPPFYNDGGFLYGVGLFETIQIHQGKPILWEQHIKRLQESAPTLNLRLPLKPEQVLKTLTQLTNANMVETAILNLYLTAGPRDSDFKFPNPQLTMIQRPCSSPTIKHETKSCFREAMFLRNKLQTVKCLAFTPSILELQKDDTQTPILTDSEGLIMESPTANVFFAKDNQLITPDHPYILPGTVRDHVIQNQDLLGIPVVKRPINHSEVAQFDEVFLSNAAWGIGFITAVQGHPNLRSGAVTDRVWRWYQESVLSPKR